MNRRGHRLVKMVTKDDAAQKKKASKKRKREESPIPPGNEQEVDYLFNNITQNLDSAIIDKINMIHDEDRAESVDPRILSEIENIGRKEINKDRISKQTLIVVQDTTERNVGDIVLEKFPEPDRNFYHHKNNQFSTTTELLSPNIVVEENIHKDVGYEKATSEHDSIPRQNGNINVTEVQKEVDDVLDDIVIQIEEITSESMFGLREEAVDTTQEENMSISLTDIVLDSPGSSFTIPTPQSSVVDSPVASPSTRNCSKKRGPGKIRKQNITEWKDLKRKALKNSGQAFINRKGESVPKKKIKPPCNCQKKCFEKVDQNCREHIFDCFWNLGSHEKQWNFILKHVNSLKPKRIKSDGPNRSQTMQYSLPQNFKTVIVCRKMFLNTLSISEKTVRNAFKKRNVASNEHDIVDMRGRHQNRPKKLKECITESVKDHILSLAPVESHYCRKNNTKKYIDGQLSYKRLHALYTEWFDSQIYGTTQATFRQYQDIVNANFNIAFYRPKKDQCDSCHVFYNIKEPSETQKIEQEKHILAKNLARSLKEADKTEAKDCDEVVTGCFDMQKILTCPFGNVGILYYKRKLNLYDFTVYELAKKVGYCYMWTEVTGKKGANEISSGLQLFIKSKLDEGAKIFKFWSDNCSGQNRNRIVFAFYQYIIEKYDIESITHRFLEVGHTQNEGDSVHSVIEGASNKKTIYTPDQWFNLIRWAKVTGEAFRVKEMKLDDILNFRALLNGKNWTKNDDGEKVAWSKVKEVKITKDNIHVIKYKYDFNEDSQTITTLKKVTRGTRNVVTSIERANITPIKLNKDKYKDLASLCQTKIIPEEYHDFFLSLPHEIAGVASSRDTDDEEE